MRTSWDISQAGVDGIISDIGVVNTFIDDIMVP